MTTDSGLPDWLTDSWRRTLRRRCLNWYSDNARDLPWRHSSDPYEIWISEIMLQQTQVKTVIPYFKKFISEIKSLKKLSSTSERKVLKLWEGLGYYRRCRNLIKTAKIIVKKERSKLPKTLVDIKKLPGIGDYTGNVLLALIYNQPRLALDGNVKRVYSRILNKKETSVDFCKFIKFSTWNILIYQGGNFLNRFYLLVP